ncbi:heterokaryon incompatibility protein [Rutstroemia sp. NJR-2017a BVV2]|nr:heterokaryon incompatibility protein [Rutstroemia sp. NJR-2017a BVV2]
MKGRRSGRIIQHKVQSTNEAWRQGCLGEDGFRTTGSEDLLQYEAGLIRRWADVCFNTHTNCAHGTGFMLTRLLDVGTADNVKLSLISTADVHIDDRRYLALSHCWGLTMPDTARTVTATLEKHKVSIQEADLSRTFRDFIGVARRLGIQHVWIDSLCIIQDDGADWEKEASQMASVSPLDVDCIPVEADFAPATTNYKFRVWTRNPSPTGISNDPLQTRGWTLQERELSPRVVNYCKDTIRWECQSLHASLEFPWDDNLSFNGDNRHFDAEQSIFLPMPGVNRSTNSPTDPRTKTAVSWMGLVVKYTSRRLTKDSDKLPAISGIARTIAERTSDEYFAGLWKSYFQEYPDPEFIPKILNIHIDPLGSDPYGMLKQGILHIEGKAATVFSLAEAENGAVSGPHRKLRLPITRQDIGHIHYDIPLITDCAPAGKPNIVFLLCCLNEKKSEDMDIWTFALALQPVLDAAQGTPGTVRRVGLATRIMPEFWEKNSTLMQLKIC